MPPGGGLSRLQGSWRLPSDQHLRWPFRGENRTRGRNTQRLVRGRADDICKTRLRARASLRSTFELRRYYCGGRPLLQQSGPNVPNGLLNRQTGNHCRLALRHLRSSDLECQKYKNRKFVKQGVTGPTCKIREVERPCIEDNSAILSTGYLRNTQVLPRYQAFAGSDEHLLGRC